jgi:hypothetical protein
MRHLKGENAAMFASIAFGLYGLLGVTAPNPALVVIAAGQDLLRLQLRGRARTVLAKQLPQDFAIRSCAQLTV